MSNLSNVCDVPNISNISDISNSDVFTSSTSNFFNGNCEMLHIEELFDRDKHNFALAVDQMVSDFEAFFETVEVTDVDVHLKW